MDSTGYHYETKNMIINSISIRFRLGSINNLWDLDSTNNLSFVNNNHFDMIDKRISLGKMNIQVGNLYNCDIGDQ